MKRRLTFLFRLKPRRADILLTVAGDILPLLPREDYITPLLSPLISLSNILLCFAPSPSGSSLGYSLSFRPDCSFQSATLKRKRALREEEKYTGVAGRKGRGVRSKRNPNLNVKWDDLRQTVDWKW